MGLESFEKQPWEEFTIAGDFTNFVLSGEEAQLTGSSVAAEDCDGVDATDDVLYASGMAVDGTKLTVKVKAGVEAKSPYKITFKINTTENRKFEVDVHMHIKEY